MWKQTLFVSVAVAACVPAQPGPVYYGSQPPPQPQPMPQPQPQPMPQPQPQPIPPPPPAQWQFDARGWTLLGSATVDGRHDRDVIPVTRYQGRFDELTMVVYDSDLQLDGFVVTFGNREKFAPQVSHYFQENSRSRAIDLPGDDRVIKSVELRYSNFRGGGPARIELYGRDTGRARPPKPDNWKFDHRGWTLLSQTNVDGRTDKDTIPVTRYKGRFDQLTMVVYDSDLTLESFVISFGNNETFAPNLRYVFKEGSRSQVIDLPGDDRVIKKIDIKYSNLPGGGKARVEIYGRDTGKPRPPKPDGWKFDDRGWTLLSQTSVDGRTDKDSIPVTRYQGRFDQLTMVVYDSDLTLDDFVITFGNGETFAPKLRHVFKEGARSRAIELPGDDRVISRIDVKYSNLPGGGKARVEIYGRDTGKPRPPKPDDWKFDNRGWTMLGSATVQGKRDQDTIRVGKYQGRFDQLTMVVYDSDLTLDDFVVVFGNNEKFSPNLKHVFKEGARSRAIDLPGDDRLIKRIELKYSNLPGGGKARVEIYGRDTGKPRPTPTPDPAPTPTPPPSPGTGFDPTGWTVIGRAIADGKHDRDVLPVTDANAYRQILIRVPDADLELKNVVITFGNKDTYSPGALVFKAGATQTLDLPGERRKIRQIELVYGAAPTGGRITNVEIYGKVKAK